VLVTPVSLGEFEGEALERRLTDPAWLGEHATAHERVLASAMREGPVLPLRFGTIFADEEQLRRSLAPHAALFGEALARAEHREEWDVKVVCETAALRRWIEATSPRISELLAEANGEDGSAYLRRKRLDRALAEEVERATDEFGRVVSEALAASAEATAPVAASEDPDAAARAVIRADAYLVHRDRTEAFRRAADETETLLADRGVEVLITGPLPPYHFVSLDLREAADA
jgi:Gas vesicle synthesis protein GvpL/GvpF